MTRTILVIDDDPDFVDLIKVLLRDGYVIEGCTDSRDGLRRIHEIKPALLFLDLNMPAPSGWELLQALREDPSFIQLPVLVVSAGEAAATLEPLAIQQSPGRLEILTKPFEIDELVFRVNQMLGSAPPQESPDPLNAPPSTHADTAN